MERRRHGARVTRVQRRCAVKRGNLDQDPLRDIKTTEVRPLLQLNPLLLGATLSKQVVSSIEAPETGAGLLVPYPLETHPNVSSPSFKKALPNSHGPFCLLRLFGD